MVHLVGLLAVVFAFKNQKLNQSVQKSHVLLPKISFHCSTNQKHLSPLLSLAFGSKKLPTYHWL